MLRTKDGRLTFHLFETIPLELEFSSSLPSTYSIELDESMNFAGLTHKFEVEPKEAILLSLLEWSSQGVICCESDHQYLSGKPTVFDRELTDYLRFEKAGTYHLFLITRRVFRGAPSSDFTASKILLTSNILTLTILPDDPEWDAQRLAETLRKLQDPHIKANYDAVEQAIKKIDSETGKDIARANRLEQTEFAQAQKALNGLDTREAIRERVHLMESMSKEQISFEGEFEAETLLHQPLLASSTRPDLVVEYMEKRAQIHDFGVDHDYVDWWAKYIVLRDHFELFRPFPDPAEHQRRIDSFFAFEVAAEQEILLQLESSLSSKNGAAKDITTLTIKGVKAAIAYQSNTKPKLR